MMKRVSIVVVVVTCLIAIALGSVIGYFGNQLSIVQRVSTLPSESALATAVFAHTLWNSSVTMTLDPWMSFAQNFTSAASDTTCYVITFALGCLFLAGAPGCIAAVCALLVCGADRALIGAVAFLPLCMWAITRVTATTRIQIPLLILLLFLGLRIPYAAGSLTPLAMLLTLGFASALVPSQNRHNALWGILALCIGASLSFARIMPEFSFDYPLDGTATVNHDAAFIPPLVGHSVGLATLNTTQINQFFILTSTTAVLLLVLLIGFVRIDLRNLISRNILRSIIGISLFEIGLRALGHSELSILQGLSRIIPGATLYPIEVLWVGALWFIVADLALHPPRDREYRFQYAAGIILTTAITLAIAINLIQEARAVQTQLRSLRVSNAIASSPSLSLLLERGLRLPVDRATFQAIQRIRAEKSLTACPISSLKTRSSPEQEWVERSPDEIKAVSDGKETTRLALPSQIGSALQICINKADGSAPTLSSIEIDAGNFRTDFPRGITISTLDGFVLLKENPWHGVVEFTKTQTLPYFGPREVVTAPIPKTPALVSQSTRKTADQPTDLECFVMTITADGQPYDWSIAELRCSR